MKLKSKITNIDTDYNSEKETNLRKGLISELAGAYEMLGSTGVNFYQMQANILTSTVERLLGKEAVKEAQEIAKKK